MNCPEGLEPIAEIAKPFQPIIDIKKSSLSPHGVISNPSNQRQSESPRVG
jgi:hypothetical protein